MTKAKKEKLTIEDALVPVEERPYEIPENWEWVFIENCCDEFFTGKSPKYSKEPTEYPIIGQQANQRYGIDLQYVKYGTQEFAEKQEDKYYLQYNDVLLNTLGTGSIGRSGIVKFNKRILTDGHPFVFRTHKYYSADLLYYYLQLNELEIINTANGSTNQRFLSQKTFGKYPIPLPPLAEQKRIVEQIEKLFTKLDEVLDKINATYEMNEEQIKAITQKAFRGELTRGYEHKKTEFVEIQDMFDVVGGIQKKPNRAPQNNPIPYVTVANVYRNRVDITDIKYFEVFDGELEKLQLHEKDILVVEGNGSGSEIGRCAMWNNELPVCIHQNHIIRLRKSDDRVNPGYVLRYLNSEQGKEIMKQKAVTTAGLYNLSTGKIKTITFPYVSIEEQDEIVTILDRLYNDNEVIQNNLSNIKEKVIMLKKSILAKAFRGELGTNIADEESSIELLKHIISE